jgi:hypothetical protein
MTMFTSKTNHLVIQSRSIVMMNDGSETDSDEKQLIVSPLEYKTHIITTESFYDPEMNEPLN